ncbi:hypothetical protein B0H13DRAFT_1889481 [Mycena leptocephala]|nr:hypothetical protein B0H13DRAFT_1889481 [Mycena leptocephala]
MPTPHFLVMVKLSRLSLAARPEPHRPGPAWSRFAPAGSRWSSTHPGINTSSAICPTPESRIISTKFSRAHLSNFKPTPSNNFARKSHKVSNPFQKFLGSWGYLRHLQDVFLLMASSRPHPPSFLDDDTIRVRDLSLQDLVNIQSMWSTWSIQLYRSELINAITMSPTLAFHRPPTPTRTPTPTGKYGTRRGVKDRNYDLEFKEFRSRTRDLTAVPSFRLTSMLSRIGCSSFAFASGFDDIAQGGEVQLIPRSKVPFTQTFLEIDFPPHLHHKPVNHLPCSEEAASQLSYRRWSSLLQFTHCYGNPRAEVPHPYQHIGARVLSSGYAKEIYYATSRRVSAQFPIRTGETLHWVRRIDPQSQQEKIPQKTLSKYTTLIVLDRTEEEDRLKHKAIPSHSKTGSTQGDSKSYQDWLKHKWNPSRYRLAQAQAVSDLGKPTKAQRIPTVYQMSCVQLKGRKIECLSNLIASSSMFMGRDSRYPATVIANPGVGVR